MLVQVKPLQLQNLPLIYLGQQKSSALLNLGALPYREGEVMRYIPDLKPFIVNGDGLI